ncbi:MAG: hypothetical protein R2795_14785 [Saprospiraceae bacterium]
MQHTLITEHIDVAALAGDTLGAYAWIEEVLVTGKGTLQAMPDSEQEGLLWHYFWEQRAARKFRGQQTFFLSWPHILQPAGEVLPVFRWPCTLEPPTLQNPHWMVSIDTALRPEYNPEVAAALSVLYPFEWEALMTACLSGQPDSRESLRQWLQHVQEDTAWVSPAEQISIAAHPVHVDSLTDNGETICWWSARVGMTHVSWAVGCQSIENPDVASFSSVDAVLPLLSGTGYRITQEAAKHTHLHIVREGWIQDFNFTGEWVKWMLHQGKTCLVVSRQKAVLEQLQQQLAAEGLSGLCWFWQQESADMPVFKGALQHFEKQPPAVPAFDSLAWRTALTRANRAQRQWDEWFAASRTPTFRGKGWWEVVIDYLAPAAQEGKELLASQLQATGYTFLPEEYDAILAAIATTGHSMTSWERFIIPWRI